MNEIIRTAHVVIDTADGNPTSFRAGVNLDRVAGYRVDPYNLWATGLAADLKHRSMSKDPDKIAAYNQSFEEERLGHLAKLGSKLAAAELTAGLMRRDRGSNYAIVRFHQEHVLMGLMPESYEGLGLGEIELVVPDVVPKISGVEALKKHGDRARAVVWNRQAEKDLEGVGITTRLVAPYILEGMIGESLPDNGDKVVFKTSGNGAPGEWIDEILEVLRSVGYQGDNWSAHVPGWRWDANRPFGQLSLGKNRRIGDFYGSLGMNTEFIVGFPSELIQVAFAMRSMGAGTNFISLPARGQHEKDNRDFAQQTGLLAAQLALPCGELADGITTIEPRDLVSFIRFYRHNEVGLDVLGQDHITAGLGSIRI